MRHTNTTFSSLPRPPSIDKSGFMARVNEARKQLSVQNTDALILVAGINMRYFCGLAWPLTERFVGAVITAQDVMFICPRFEQSAIKAALNTDGEFLFWQEDENPSEVVARFLHHKNLRSVAVDPKCPLWLFEQLQSALPAMSLRSAVSLIGNLRARKNKQELDLIQYAMSLTLTVHERAYAYLQAGRRASEVIRFIDEQHRQLGADNGSYFCTVQFGEGTSHPHGVPGDPVLHDDTLVLIDTGCQVDGYHSDITRTYGFGQVSDRISDMWEIEKAAQAAAFAAAKPGVPCAHIDQAARDLLKQKGLGPDYELPGLPHRTGHGIGLEIHEGPYLVRGDNTPLQPGMCFSNEPMIVVPGEFGVRLEDHFYVTHDKAQWFTPLQKSLYSPF
ncbi:Xaa-Pro peptidase family protein [Alteromonas sp. C1M14]|uniref:M24 family metallopeptidase n=1 Tax=Alteromonas sp. C1M14 TaxID=2841567 RepID=UPI001C0A49EC|nr:Xaa-Pro peptidase family protein [Alteromonas sp. C1M14]MBU2979988.1 Xaa-Pro peptidase family protein [Alteromonas sp. C1M14]